MAATAEVISLNEADKRVSGETVSLFADHVGATKTEELALMECRFSENQPV